MEKQTSPCAMFVGAKEAKVAVVTNTGYLADMDVDYGIKKICGDGEHKSITLLMKDDPICIVSSILGGELSDDIASIVCEGGSIEKVDLYGLSSLSVISMTGCDMEEFSSDSCEQLVYLGLSGNMLSEIGINDAVNVTCVDVHENMIKRFHPERFPSMEVLDIHENHIRFLDFSHENKVKYVSAGMNLINKFHGSGCRKIVHLCLSDNMLEAIDVSGMQSLVFLLLDRNSLTEFSAAGLTSLAYLNLDLNRLESVDMSGASIKESVQSYIGYSFRNNNLSAEAINNLFETLGEDYSGNGIIHIGGNPGSATCDPSIATNKGYIVTGV